MVKKCRLCKYYSVQKSKKCKKNAILLCNVLLGTVFLILLKFTFSEKATKIDKIFTVNLTVCSNCQMDGEDFVIFFAFLENMNFTWLRHRIVFTLGIFSFAVQLCTDSFTVYALTAVY